jgi:hypothetical protein
MGMSDTGDEQDLSLVCYRSFIPLPNPRLPTQPPLLQGTKHLKAEPIATAATAHPAHTDRVLQTVQILINDWSFYPIATFEEMLHIYFREDVKNTIGRPIEVAESESHIALSLPASRARSIGILNTPRNCGTIGGRLRRCYV